MNTLKIYIGWIVGGCTLLNFGAITSASTSSANQTSIKIVSAEKKISPPKEVDCDAIRSQVNQLASQKCAIEDKLEALCGSLLYPHTEACQIQCGALYDDQLNELRDRERAYWNETERYCGNSSFQYACDRARKALDIVRRRIGFLEGLRTSCIKDCEAQIGQIEDPICAALKSSRNQIETNYNNLCTPPAPGAACLACNDNSFWHCP